MNFFGHAVVASWRSPSPGFGFGANAWINAGTMNFNVGGTTTSNYTLGSITPGNSGTMSVAAGTLNMGLGTVIHNAGAAVNGAGTIDIGFGTQLLNANVTFSPAGSTWMNGGNIAGAGDFVNGSTLNWSGGSFLPGGRLLNPVGNVVNSGGFTPRNLGRLLAVGVTTVFNPDGGVNEFAQLKTAAAADAAPVARFFGTGPAITVPGASLGGQGLTPATAADAPWDFGPRPGTFRASAMVAAASTAVSAHARTARIGG